MTREEAEQVVNEVEGRVCVRFYRRADGKIMTRDCGRAVRAGMKLKVAVGGVLSVLGISFAFPVMGATKPTPEFLLRHYGKEIQNIDEQLKSATTHDERLSLREQKQRYQGKVAEIWERQRLAEPSSNE